ncbi:MAG: amylo-alpha-1,6-glucosidase [Pyrinomonadaceae bacterium]
MIEIDESRCRDFQTATSLEWLETNGQGGFAFGTVSGAATRRYHSYLTAAVNPPVGRYALVAKFEETLEINGEFFELSSNNYPGTVYPKGYEFLTSFRLDPFPIWTFRCGDILLEKRLFMPKGRNATVVRYSTSKHAFKTKQKIRLKVRPLISCKDFHTIIRRGDLPATGYKIQDGVIEMQPDPSIDAVIFFSHNAASVIPTGYWYENFQYLIEAERGFDYSEDLYQPFEMEFDFRRDVSVIISTGRSIEAAAAAELEKSEINRRKKILQRSGLQTEFEKSLVLAADQFIVARGNGNTIIAGYPWFSDWGRDTMISLSGLALVTNRNETARSILIEYAKYVSEGMIPNRFPDKGESPDYNTADATLWYFEAVRAYVEKTGDIELVETHLYKTLAEIIRWHLNGTRYQIRVDTDGLLQAGTPQTQLTWMDAKSGERVFTPRNGKPVELQALWYNALRSMADFAEVLGYDDDRVRFDSLANLTRFSFNAVFWNADAGCLYDVVENGRRDASVRPNQLFAIALPHPVLERRHWRTVVDRVRSDLLTPFGLRTLSPADPNYVGRYEGPPASRDAAYHQGTVWAWLMGPFIDAFRRAYAEEKDVESESLGLLAAFEDHLKTACLGQISEIFDGDPPHTPRGCPAQAWSVAEILRVYSTILKKANGPAISLD